jgi:hypothetical protein
VASCIRRPVDNVFNSILSEGLLNASKPKGSRRPHRLGGRGGRPSWGTGHRISAQSVWGSVSDVALRERHDALNAQRRQRAFEGAA